MARAVHLIRRFAGMLVPWGPSAGDEAWVAGVLSPAELRLWRRMAGADRRHAVGVARRVAAALGPEATAPVLAAALLHDVGKVDARLGPYGRAVATLCGLVADDTTVRQWRRGRGIVRRVGLYLDHPRIGAEMLAIAGSDPTTAAWAAEHHLPPDRWTIPLHLADALKAADDD